MVSSLPCKGGCGECACQYLLGSVQVGEDAGLHVKARILLYGLTEEHSLGSAMAALLKGPASQALLSALEDAVTRYSSTPIAQVRTIGERGFLLENNNPEGDAPVPSAPPDKIVCHIAVKLCSLTHSQGMQELPLRRIYAASLTGARQTPVFSRNLTSVLIRI